MTEHVSCRPYRSCLHSPAPDLDKVLNVLSLAHKYSINPLKEHARSVAITLTDPTALTRHISLSRTPSLEHILRVGSETDTRVIVESVVDVIVNALAYSSGSWVHIMPRFASHVLLDLADDFCAP